MSRTGHKVDAISAPAHAAGSAQAMCAEQQATRSAQDLGGRGVGAMELAKATRWAGASGGASSHGACASGGAWKPEERRPEACKPSPATGAPAARRGLDASHGAVRRRMPECGIWIRTHRPQSIAANCAGGEPHAVREYRGVGSTPRPFSDAASSGEAASTSLDSRGGGRQVARRPAPPAQGMQFHVWERPMRALQPAIAGPRAGPCGPRIERSSTPARWAASSMSPRPRE